MSKKCPGCGKEKFDADFYRNKSTLDGLAVYCRECMRNRAAKAKSDQDSWYHEYLQREKAKRKTPEGRAKTRLLTSSRTVERRAAAHNYTARQKGVVGEITADDIRAILNNQNTNCKYCEQELEKNWAIDHIVALSTGGTNTSSNIQIICKMCNAEKRNLTHDEYRVVWEVRKAKVAGLTSIEIKIIEEN